jgi:hypothetical protein
VQNFCLFDSWSFNFTVAHFSMSNCMSNLGIDQPTGYTDAVRDFRAPRTRDRSSATPAARQPQKPLRMSRSALPWGDGPLLRDHVFPEHDSTPPPAMKTDESTRSFSFHQHHHKSRDKNAHSSCVLCQLEKAVTHVKCTLEPLFSSLPACLGRTHD